MTKFEPLLTHAQRRGLRRGELHWQERKDGSGKLDALIDSRSYIVGRPPLVEVSDEDSRELLVGVAIAAGTAAVSIVATYTADRWRHRREIRELTDRLRELSEEREVLATQLQAAQGDEQRHLREQRAKVDADIIDLGLRRRELETRRPRLIHTG